MNVPKSFRRLVQEIEGWLELGCPERALEGLSPMLETPGARPAALMLRIRALIDLERYPEAVRAIEELRPFAGDDEWVDVQEGWCRKRMDDVPGAIACMERLIRRDPRSAIGHYNLGCYLAIAGDKERALDEVTIACGIDASFRRHATSETDLDPLRDDPRFAALLPRTS